IRRDEGVAQLLGVRHHADAAPHYRLDLVQRDQGFDIEELVTAGLKKRRNVGGAVTGVKRERLWWRHLAGREGALELGHEFSDTLALGFRGGEIGAGLVLERGQDLGAAVTLFDAFLVVAKPEGGVSAEENEEELGRPTEEAGAPGLSRRHDAL